MPLVMACSPFASMMIVVEFPQAGVHTVSNYGVSCLLLAFS